MTLDSKPAEPDAESPPRRKPRLWVLITPFALIALALALYGAYWLVARSRLEAGLESRAAALRQAGYQASLEGLRIDGFPFRMRVAFKATRIASPSGWAVEIPGLKGEAYLHDLGHWVLVAPEGLTVTRPKGGPLAVRGEALRASVAGIGRAPWRITLEGSKLVFTPGPAALPFSFASMERITLGLRPAPDGSPDGEAGLQITGGRAAPQTVVWRLAGDKPVTVTLDSRVVKPAAFKGGSWGEAVRAWTDGGGQVQLLKAEMQGGITSLWAKSGTLSVGSDGRVSGSAPLELRQGAQGLTALAGAPLDETAAHSAAAVAAARDSGGTASLNLVFQAGVATLGPVQIGPSPKIY